MMVLKNAGCKCVSHSSALHWRQWSQHWGPLERKKNGSSRRSLLGYQAYSLSGSANTCVVDLIMVQKELFLDSLLIYTSLVTNIMPFMIWSFYEFQTECAHENFHHCSIASKQFYLSISGIYCWDAVVGWPCLDVSCPPKLLYPSPSSTGQGRENIMKGSWVEDRGRSLTDYHCGQNRELNWGN